MTGIKNVQKPNYSFSGTIKTLAFSTCALLASTISAYSRTFDNENEKPAKTSEKKDSSAANTDAATVDYGFKNLFVTENFNPAQPYETQLNPQAIPFVEDYIQKFGAHLEGMKTWAQPYFNLMDNILISNNIPKEMKYLAVIESNLKPWATSWVGAVGPWQFMPATGRNMGLVINGYTDERTNYYKSSQAAARYLKILYSQLGDWLLVIAAYNGGPGRVFSAIRKSGSRNFWELQNYLPLESRNHVKKFIATHYIMEGHGGMTTATTEEWNTQQLNNLNRSVQAIGQLPASELANTSELNIHGKYNSLIMAKNLSMDIAQFNKLNPGFDAMVDGQAGFNLRLPEDKMLLFNANRYIILHECILTALQTPVNSTMNFPNENKLKTGKTTRRH
jgi:membrane-bound lytic murein transglycosylase D